MRPEHRPRSLPRRLLRLLAAGLLDRVTFASITIYLATFLAVVYRVDYVDLAIGLAIVAAGNFIGNAIGGRLADRVRDRIALFGATLAATAALNIFLMSFAPGYAFSVALGFAVLFVNALGRAPYLAAVSEVPESVRGAVMGLNVMMAAVSWFGAALIGGLVERLGFDVVAVFGAGASLAGAYPAPESLDQWRRRHDRSAVSRALFARTFAGGCPEALCRIRVWRSAPHRGGGLARNSADRRAGRMRESDPAAHGRAALTLRAIAGPWAACADRPITRECRPGSRRPERRPTLRNAAVAGAAC